MSEELSADLMREATRRAEARRRQGQPSPDYAHIAKSFSSQSELDAHGLAQELVEIGTALDMLSPRPRSFRGICLAVILRVFGPLLRFALHAPTLRNPLHAVYRTALYQQEKQLELEAQIARELADIRARLGVLESAVKSGAAKSDTTRHPPVSSAGSSK